MNLDHFLELPRLSGLSVSPDGDRLVVTVSVLDPKRTGFTSSLWEVPVDPQGPAPRRLTWGGTGESRPVFTGHHRPAGQQTRGCLASQDNGFAEDAPTPYRQAGSLWRGDSWPKLLVQTPRRLRASRWNSRPPQVNPTASRPAA